MVVSAASGPGLFLSLLVEEFKLGEYTLIGDNGFFWL